MSNAVLSLLFNHKSSQSYLFPGFIVMNTINIGHTTLKYRKLNRRKCQLLLYKIIIILKIPPHFGVYTTVYNTFNIHASVLHKF